jgi:hypothetical protein
MHHAQLTEAVRRRVAEAFAQTGGPPARELRETILVSGGAYCGRRFDAPNGHAIWFVEEDQLKFYHPDGSVVEVFEPAVHHATRARIAA